METQYLDLDGGRIAYDVRGSGPLVICAPSMGDVRAEYRFLAAQLAAAGFTVATLDVRGHGESSVDWPDYSVAGVGSDMLALAQRLDAGPAMLVGCSMAGGAAVWAAAEAPWTVSGLVLIDAFVRDFPANFMSKLYPALFADLWGPAFWVYYYSSLYRSRKPADFAGYKVALGANLRQPGRMAALRAMIMASKAESEARLGQVQAPALVLAGTRDPDFKDPAAEAGWIGQALGAPVQMIEGAGHYPHAEMPEETAPAIVAFLHAKIEKAGHGR